MFRLRGIMTALLLIVSCIIVISPVLAAGEPSANALTRGSRFTITIIGLPDTPYYIWLTRTSAMTGKPGDQPPVIVAFQSTIQQDPPEGPYTIGSYVINNGNGRTIRDDVAPSTPEQSNTNYYALVTTDRDGRAVVVFQTSFATATRTFSVKVENPRSAAHSDILIELGLPSNILTTPFPGSAVITPELMSETAINLTESPNPVPVIVTTITIPILTPPQQSVSGWGCGIMAILAGLLVWSSKKFFR